MQEDNEGCLASPLSVLTRHPKQNISLRRILHRESPQNSGSRPHAQTQREVFSAPPCQRRGRSALLAATRASLFKNRHVKTYSLPQRSRNHRSGTTPSPGPDRTGLDRTARAHSHRQQRAGPDLRAPTLITSSASVGWGEAQGGAIVGDVNQLGYYFGLSRQFPALAFRPRPHTSGLKQTHIHSQPDLAPRASAYTPERLGLIALGPRQLSEWRRAGSAPLLLGSLSNLSGP